MDIAIIGGGVGGLTLACVLRCHGIEPIVHEREAIRPWWIGNHRRARWTGRRSTARTCAGC